MYSVKEVKGRCKTNGTWLFVLAERTTKYMGNGYVHPTDKRYIGGYLKARVLFVDVIDIIHRDLKLWSQNAIEKSLTGTSEVERRT